MSAPQKRRRRVPKVLYSRELPGGGYVTIQTELSDESLYRGWISVERRSDRQRRNADAAPVIAEAQGETVDSVYLSLHRIASDNVAVAKEIRRWESEQATGN